MHSAAAADPGSSKRTFAQLAEARRFLGEALAKPFAARFSLWLHVGLALYGATQVWSSGRAGLGSALGALALPAMIALAAFFRPLQSQAALLQLAKGRGFTPATLTQGLFLARTWLLLRPFTLSVPLLWLSALHAESAARAWLGFPLGLLASWACGAGLSLCLAAAAWLSEQWSEQHPGRVLMALVLIPALLQPAVPEMPSVWHSFRAWAEWSAGPGGNP